MITPGVVMRSLILLIRVTAKCIIILLSSYSSKCVIACNVFSESYTRIMLCDIATYTAAYPLLTEQSVCCNPGRENDSRKVLEDLENLAPSPLIFILIRVIQFDGCWNLCHL